MIVSSINHSALVHTTHITINQKDQVFSHALSPLLYHGVFTFVCSTSNLYFASCPFNACMFTTFNRSINSLCLDLNNVITANSFYIVIPLNSPGLD